MKKALVVDNNEVILKILSHTLQTRGLQVQTAKDGLSALQTLEHYRPDIIFTDLIMPNIDGENLCRIISGRKDLSATLLIVVSAIAVEGNLDFLDFGAHACIAKGPASKMRESIDLILSHVKNGQIDLLKGKLLGAEDLVPRTVAKELIEAKHHFKLIFDNIDNGILEFADSGIIVNCNSYLTRFLDRKVLDIISLNIRDLFPGDTQRHVNECLDRFLNTRRPVESTRSTHVNNKDIVFKLIRVSEGNNSTSIMIIKDMSEELSIRRQLEKHLKQLEEIVAAKTKSYEDANIELEKEITERKKINEKLEFVARQWSDTFDTISDFVSVHDNNMKLVRVNKALTDFFGKKPEELLGKYCYEVIHCRNSPWINCPHIAASKQKETVTVEVDDKNIGIPLLVTCSPLMHSDGSLLGSVHVARDISVQKNASDLREKLIKQLEVSLAKVKLLSGFIPICASCKNIRDDKGYWKQVEEYIRDHSEAEFSHSICPTCAKKLYPDLMNDLE